MLALFEGLTARAVRRQGLHRNKVGHETEEESVARVLAIVEKTMKKASLCTCITLGPDGPTARIVMPFKPDPDLTIHIGTSPQTNKSRQVAATGRVVLVYSDGMSAGLTVFCTAELVSDPHQLHRWWRQLFLAFWPDGPDKDYVLIRCSPYAFELYAPSAGVGPAPLGLRSARIQLEGDKWHLASSKPEA